MKKALILSILTTASILQACHSGKDSKAAADSINRSADTSKTAMPITVDQADAQFAVNAANGNMVEVMDGKLAQDKGSSSVKDFGAMMVKDHSAANDELMTLAKSKNITLPAVAATNDLKHFNDLNKMSGTDFDKAYVKLMLNDHKTDVKAFEEAAKNTKDPDLKAFAAKTLPTLKMHLDAISKIDSAMNKQ